MLAHLSSDAVLAIHEEVLMAHGGRAGLRDKALLLSAVSAPKATSGGEPIMTDPVEVAAPTSTTFATIIPLSTATNAQLLHRVWYFLAKMTTFRLRS